MNLNDIAYALQDVIYWTFDFIPSFSWVNNVILLGGFVGVGAWLKMQGDFNKIEEKDGYYK